MNLLYIHTHDSGKVLSPYGYQVPTPYLSKWSKEATLFQNAFCVSPTCSPSRAAMLTGMYPHQVGMLGLAQRGFHLDTSKHLVQYLNQHGYQSVLCGIQHEAGWYLDHAAGSKKLGYQIDLTCDNQGYEQEDLGEWDKLNAKKLAGFIKDSQFNHPFFISYGMYSTHRAYPKHITSEVDVNQVLPPYPMPNNEETRLDHARYLSSAKIADECIEEVIEALKKSGHYEDTLILFTTDHGLANPFCKCNLQDSGTAVSLIMRVPDTIGNGRCIDQLVSHLDIFPTLCDLLKLDKPNWLMGKSFAEAFDGKSSSSRKYIFSEINFHTSYEPVRAIRDERYKYIVYYDLNYLRINGSNIDESISKDFLMKHDLMNRVKIKEALYDLYYDPGERNNCIHLEENQVTLERLKEALKSEMKRSNDPLLNGSIVFQKGWKVNKRECLKASSKNTEDYESLND